MTKKRREITDNGYPGVIARREAPWQSNRTVMINCSLVSAVTYMDPNGIRYSLPASDVP